MRVIQKPNISPVRTFLRCCSSYRANARNNFRNITQFISIQASDYDHRATNKNLYTYTTHTHVCGNIFKQNMLNLYNDKMVRHSTGRTIYDRLMSLAPLKRCPFCGIGEVRTLDHYLPEANFPTFAVLPYNLVACCRDCNTDKLTSYATTQGAQALHPYYDDFTNEQWLFARVLQTLPVSIEFYVEPPEDWDDVDKERVESHFNNYKLAGRFSVAASSILVNLRYKFMEYHSSPVDIRNELEKEYNVNMHLHLNSWETAMYQALYQNEWYCNGGL